MTLITTNTESGDANSAFTSGIDSTYKLYIFKFIDLNPATDAAYFTFNGSIDGGSNYNVTKTATFFRAYNTEDNSGTAVGYRLADDSGQQTGYQRLHQQIGNAADESAAGTLWLFNPSNTAYSKHFYSAVSGTDGTQSRTGWVSGYFNTTDNIDAVDFKMSSGNMDGIIKMYGVG